MAALFVAVCLGSVAVPGARAAEEPDVAALKAAFRRPEAIPFPADNPHTPATERLGRDLFADPRLSKSGTTACDTCHQPGREFSDGKRFARGDAGEAAARHTPSLWNLAWGRAFFWDGRAASLEAQALEPIRTEMGLGLDEAVGRLRADPAMRRGFADAFPNRPEITADNLGRALATYVRTLVSPRNRFDRWIEGDENALGPAERAGFGLFVGKAGCVRCHQGWAFTDYGLHDIGLHDDLGRGAATGVSALNHAFKTPSLRGIRWSAPYMHDGRFTKLRYVVEHYAGGFVRRPGLAAEITGFALSESETRDLIAFLRAIGDGGLRPEPLRPETRDPSGPIDLASPEPPER